MSEKELQAMNTRAEIPRTGLDAKQIYCAFHDSTNYVKLPGTDVYVVHSTQLIHVAMKSASNALLFIITRDFHCEYPCLHFRCVLRSF